jgi:uncharacterized membrane protein
MSTRFFFVSIAVAAFLGVLNAGYLAWSAALGNAPTCFLNSGCDIVASSPYSKVFGIPLATFGVFFYTMIFGFALWRVFVPKAPALWYLFPLATLGFLLSLYFLYLQAVVIDAYCEYCLFSLIDATIIFVCAAYLWLRDKKDVIIDTEQNTESEHEG